MSAALLSNTEAMFTVVFAFTFLKERLSVAGYLAAAAILAGAVIVTLDLGQGGGAIGATLLGNVLLGRDLKIFEVEGLSFDTAAGRFVSHGAFAGRARVRGDGIAARWTRRALERAGYEVVDDGPVEVDVSVLDGPAWRLDGRDLGSLGELSAAVRRRGQDEA